MDTKREDRLCQMCHSSRDVEDEQHFLFSCPAYSDNIDKSMPVFFSRPFLSQTFSVTLKQMRMVIYQRVFFTLKIYCIHLT